MIVSEKVISKHDQISVFDARRIKADAQIGEEVEVEVTPTGFGRIAAQYAKQALMQHIRRAEKELIFTEFKDRVGDIISGTVRRFDRSDVISGSGQIRGAAAQPRTRADRGISDRRANSLLCQSRRTRARTVRKLFFPALIRGLSSSCSSWKSPKSTMERSKSKGIAREPGFRTKLAVYTRDEKVDPVGACVGLRGQRVKNIVRELNNEKVDIIRWDPNVRNFITNALAPAKLKSFEIDEATQAREDHRQRGSTFAGDRQARSKRAADFETDWLAGGYRSRSMVDQRV